MLLGMAKKSLLGMAKKSVTHNFGVLAQALEDAFLANRKYFPGTRKYFPGT